MDSIVQRSEGIYVEFHYETYGGEKGYGDHTVW